MRGPWRIVDGVGGESLLLTLFPASPSREASVALLPALLVLASQPRVAQVLADVTRALTGHRDASLASPPSLRPDQLTALRFAVASGALRLERPVRPVITIADLPPLDPLPDPPPHTPWTPPPDELPPLDEYVPPLDEVLPSEPPPVEPAVETHWVGLRLVDQDGAPVADRPWRVRDAAGTEHTGSLDASGQARVDDLPAGDVSIWCPDAGSSPETPYTMRMGEHLAAVAARLGFDDEILLWNDPANAALSAQRASPYVLAPGDVVRLPARSVEPATRPVDGTHTFTIARRPLAVSLRFEDAARQPRSQLAFASSPAPLTTASPTDDEGAVTLAVDRSLLALDLTLGPASLPASLGSLDPIDTDAGVRARLANLGYLVSDPDDAEDDEMAFALEQLQADVDLPTTGQLDDATRAQLLSLHGV